MQNVKKNPVGFIQDDWARQFCASVQMLTSVHKIQSFKYFAGQVGVSSSYLSHILAKRRNFPVEHRLQADSFVAKLWSEADDEVRRTKVGVGDMPAFIDLLAENEQLIKEITYLKEWLADKDLLIMTQRMLIERFCGTI